MTPEQNQGTIKVNIFFKLFRTIKVGIIGSGKFGTALAFTTGQKHHVTLYSRYDEEVQEINTHHTHTKLFPHIDLPHNIHAHKGIDASIHTHDILFLAVPFQALGDVYSKIKPFLNPKTSIINCGKGLDIETGMTGSQLFEQFFGSKNMYGVLSGPNFAGEIIKRDITMAVIASENDSVCHQCQNALDTRFFYTQDSQDIIGTEICGALKNIIAMASGIHKSLDLGDNSKALLFTRGMQEIAFLVERLGGQKDTILGLSGLGDMILTSSSFNSRNYQLGVWLGDGYSVEEALQKIHSTVESVHTIKSAYNLMREFKLTLPIVETLHRLILGETLSKSELMNNLLIRPIINHEAQSRHQKLFDI